MPDDTRKLLWTAEELQAQERAVTQRLNPNSHLLRTGLSRLGIAPHIAELCIAHRQQGLARVYDQHRYDVEKAHAFAAWAAHVLRMVEPPEGVVVPLRPAQ